MGKTAQHPENQPQFPHLTIAEPLAVEDPFVGLLEAQFLKESILGLVDKEAAGGHGSEKEKLRAWGGSEQQPGEKGSHGARPLGVGQKARVVCLLLRHVYTLPSRHHFKAVPECHAA